MSAFDRNDPWKPNIMDMLSTPAERYERRGYLERGEMGEFMRTSLTDQGIREPELVTYVAGRIDDEYQRRLFPHWGNFDQEAGAAYLKLQAQALVELSKGRPGGWSRSLRHTPSDKALAMVLAGQPGVREHLKLLKSPRPWSVMAATEEPIKVRIIYWDIERLAFSVGGPRQPSMRRGVSGDGVVQLYRLWWKIEEPS